MMKGINYNNVRWLVSMLTVLFTIHCSLFTASTAHAQGIPYIRNYTAEEYHGNNNNYDIDIDENGNIFVANFEGLMYYDHAQWRIIRTPGITRVTVVYRSTSNTIWVGGYNYFGRIMTKENGELALTRVGKPELFRGEVTEIYEQGGKLMFFVNNGSIYEVDGNKVTLMKSIDKNRVRIGMMDVIDINALDNEGAELVKNDTVETEELDNGLSAIIRKNNGMQIADENTGKSFYITDKNGLCSNNVTYTAYNERGQLWGTTAKGVFSMQVPSAYSRFTHYEGLTGEVLSILKVDGTIYVGTDDGLYRLNGRQFEHVTSVKYACWDMKKSSQGGLLAATAEGVFRIFPNGQSKQLSIRTATALLEDGQDIYCGEQNGVYLMGPNGQGKRKVSGLENVRKIFKDNNGTIWLQSLYGEVWYKKTDAKLFSHYRIKSKTETMSTFVVTGQEVKVVSVEDTKPFPYPLFSYTDEKDVTWLTDNEGKNLYRWKDGKRLTDMDQLLFPLHEITIRAMFINDDKIWIGSDNGLTVIDTRMKEPMLDISPQLFIRSVVLNSDSVLWGGFGLMPKVLSDLNHSENDLTFTYSINYTPIIGKTLYRYRMDDNKWSAWSTNTHASYTNIPDYAHTFYVQAKDAMNRESEVVSIGFYITPPFYRQWYMYLLYALILAAIVYVFVQLRLRKLERDKIRLERIVQDRTAEVVKQKDEIEEKSKSLEKALDDLNTAQNELIRQEKMATVGKLTQGLIDRILNPLNYINNFAKLSEGLVKDIEANIEDDKDNMDSENYEDTIDVLGMLQGNLQKVGEHGQNTTRTLKAMEEMLKDRSGGIVKMDLARVLRQDEEMIRTYFAKDIDEHQIQVSFDLPTGELPINGNAEQLSKTLMSMLGNSIYALIKKVQRVKFQPEVRLTAKAVGDCVQLSVYDNGIGIEETIINKVFDPFFTTKPTGEASGVGLYLSREIIQNHGGDISVKSVKDEYSEFIITLPALTV